MNIVLNQGQVDAVVPSIKVTKKVLQNVCTMYIYDIFLLIIISKAT
jgi:hypothetical protein